MEFINNGIQIDCNQTLYAAKVVCSEMRKHQSIKIINPEKTLLRYRWFDKVCFDTSKIFNSLFVIKEFFS